MGGENQFMYEFFMLQFLLLSLKGETEKFYEFLINLQMDLITFVV